MFKIGDIVRARYEIHRDTYQIDTGVIIKKSFRGYMVKFLTRDEPMRFSPANLVLVKKKLKIKSRPWK